jgi:hypothetical protein
MNSEARRHKGLSTVPLLNAVFCGDCETISNSPHEGCAICGSRSLMNLDRMLGGSLSGEEQHDGKTANYNLELVVKVRDVPANEMNRAIESMSRLAEVCGDVEALRINVEPVLRTKAALRAA